MEYGIFDQSISLIGCGNLGRALIVGFCGVDGAINLEKITIYDRNNFKIANCVENVGDKVKIAKDLKSAVEASKLLIIAIKPKDLSPVLKEIGSYLKKDQTIISLAAGVPVDEINLMLGSASSVVRVMPNIAAMVGESISLIYGTEEKNISEVKELFSLIGEAIVFEREDEINVAGVLGACVPAIAAQIIDGLADGGVKMGLKWDRSMLIAAQATLGAASMIVDLCVHPSEIKNMVASPGGTTVESLHVLEKAALRGALISAVAAATEKAFELGSKKEDKNKK